MLNYVIEFHVHVCTSVILHDIIYHGQEVYISDIHLCVYGLQP